MVLEGQHKYSSRDPNEEGLEQQKSSTYVRIPHMESLAETLVHFVEQHDLASESRDMRLLGLRTC